MILDAREGVGLRFQRAVQRAERGVALGSGHDVLQVAGHCLAHQDADRDFGLGGVDERIAEQIVQTAQVVADHHRQRFIARSDREERILVERIAHIWYIHRAIRRQKLQLIWLNDIDSVFPTVLSWLVATAATLYASIQHFVPGTWEQFYYNPSLNPFSLPFILSLFMFNIWGIILVGLATLDDLFHQTHIEAACFYLLGLMSCCIFLYLFFTFTTYYYLGYPCLLVYAVWSFNRIKHASRYKFSCGNCGAKMKNKGVCPHCGAVNE